MQQQPKLCVVIQRFCFFSPKCVSRHFQIGPRGTKNTVFNQNSCIFQGFWSSWHHNCWIFQGFGSSWNQNCCFQWTRPTAFSTEFGPHKQRLRQPSLSHHARETRLQTTVHVRAKFFTLIQASRINLLNVIFSYSNFEIIL